MVGWTPEDERLYKIMWLKTKRESKQLCDIATASDLMEFERDPGCSAHCTTMQYAANAGYYGQELSLDFVLELHARLFPYGGSFRTSEVYINGSSHLPPAPYAVPYALYDWIANVEWWIEHRRKDTYLLLAQTHLDFERIHPFQDGNGRVGRMLMQYIAARIGVSFIKLAPVIRDRYLDCLQECNVDKLASLFKECKL